MQPYGPSNTKCVSTALTPGQALYIDLYNGQKKCFKLRWDKHLVLAVLGGYLVAIFSHCATAIYVILTANGANPGWAMVIFSIVFSTALTAIVLTGADLLTSNMFYSSLISFDMAGHKSMKVDVGGGITVLRLIKYIGTSFIGNFIGAAVIGVTLSKITNVNIGSAHTGICYLSEKKAVLGPLEQFARGILANTCIVIATHAINLASSVEGKIAAMLAPVLAFCVGGGEHVVANMFIVFMGYFHGECDMEVLTPLAITQNIGMAFLGNFAAAIFFAAILTHSVMLDGKIGEKYDLGGEEFPIHVRNFSEMSGKDLFLAHSEETEIPDDTVSVGLW